MTSWSLRPASRARNAPAVWIPSCEFPARRITASLIFSGRRSARSEGGLPVDGTEGGLPLAAVPVGDGGLSAVADFWTAVSGQTTEVSSNILNVSTTQPRPIRPETRRVPARKLEEARCCREKYCARLFEDWPR